MKRIFFLFVAAIGSTNYYCSMVDASPSNRRYGFPSIPGRRYSNDDDDDDDGIVGAGREFDIFQKIESASSNKQSNEDTIGLARPVSTTKNLSSSTTATRQKVYRAASSSNPSSNPFLSSASSSSDAGGFFQTVEQWWSTALPNLPKFIFRVEPTTRLKLRKTFRPLGTIVKLGAEFNTALGVWQFKSSWEDALIGGKLTLAGKELQFTKSWQLSMGPVEDLVTRLRFRAAVDLENLKAYARVGLRSERLSPLNIIEGFSFCKKVPLTGQNGAVKLEIKAKVALPEPEIEISTINQNSLVGMGDIEVNIEELNLLLDY